MKLLLICAIGCGSLLAPDLTVRASRAKQLATITVNLTPAANHRHLYVSATSANVHESSYRQLEGERGRAQYRFEMRLPNDGVYAIEAFIRDGAGKAVGRASTNLVTMPPIEGYAR